MFQSALRSPDRSDSSILCGPGLRKLFQSALRSPDRSDKLAKFSESNFDRFQSALRSPDRSDYSPPPPAPLVTCFNPRSGHPTGATPYHWFTAIVTQPVSIRAPVTRPERLAKREIKPAAGVFQSALRSPDRSDTRGPTCRPISAVSIRAPVTRPERRALEGGLAGIGKVSIRAPVTRPERLIEPTHTSNV